MKGELWIVMFFLFFSFAGANYSEPLVEIDQNEEIYSIYLKMDKQLKVLAERGIKMLIPYFLEANEHIRISGTCTSNLFSFLTGVRSLKESSLKLLDATGKPQSGLLTGNIQMFGEYNQCIETTVMSRGKIDFSGQYCSLIWKTIAPKEKGVLNGKVGFQGLINATRNSSDFMKIFAKRVHLLNLADPVIGVCVPSGCTPDDVSKIVNYLTKSIYMNVTVSHCLKDGDVIFWTKTRIVIVSIFVLLGTIVVTSTLLDNTLKEWKNNELEGTKSIILQCFSLTRNFPKLINTDVPKTSITSFYGIRTLTIFWIILAHEYIVRMIKITINHSVYAEDYIKLFFSQIILNGFYTVDIFFFISGFFNCYIRMKLRNAVEPEPGIFKIILHRLWRIYPSYAVSFLLFFLLNKPGPIYFPFQKLFADHCRRYWWRNILFINNFFDPEEMCIPQSWYISADTQLFLVSLLTVPVLMRNPKKGILLHVSIILLANVASMSWWFLGNLSPSTADFKNLSRSMIMSRLKIYVLPPLHIGPYVIGILLGFVIASKKERKIPKIFQILGWIVAPTFFISILFMTVKWANSAPYTKLESAFYGAFSGTVFILGFSWLVFCCITGHAALFNYILSLKIWIPLSRLTYMIYLVSPLIQIFYVFNLSYPEEVAYITLIWSYFGNLSISILMSLALVLLVESPVIALEKIFFGRYELESEPPVEVEKEMTQNKIKENGVEENGKAITIRL